MASTELGRTPTDHAEGRVASEAARAVRSRLAIRFVSRAIPVALAVVTFAVFLPALRNDFVEWDDVVNLVDNPHYRGFHWPQIRWMFTAALMGHYIPVTWLTFALDYTLWGMDPLGYHLTNVILHAVNAALFYAVGTRLLAQATTLSGGLLRLAGVAATLVFAVHPLRAESVAWATERRDVLSGFFFLLCVLAYVAAARAEGRRRRWLLAGALGTYALGLMSKSIVMTLPLVLVLLDVYPLGRLRWHRRLWADAGTRAALVEKVPFLALGLAGAAVSYWAVASQHYLTSLAKYPWTARVGITAYSLWFYASKTAFPLGLSLLYELPARVDPLAPRFLLPALGVIAISLIVLALRRRWPAGLAVWVYYGLVLGPVTGIVHAGHQLAHDRYSYLSCLGWALLVGAAVADIVRRGAAGRISPWVTRLAAAAFTAWIFALATLTWYQVQVWRDTDTLWRYGVESDPECAICQANVGHRYLKLKLYDLARERYERVLALRPDRTSVHGNLGVALANLGDLDGAMEHFHLGLAQDRNNPEILANLGLALMNLGRYPEASGYLTRAVGQKPDHIPSLVNLGLLLIETGQPAAALEYLTRAVQFRPEEPLVHLNLANAYHALAETDKARAERDILLRLDPELAARSPFPPSKIR